jgi:hypothetical protein
MSPIGSLFITIAKQTYQKQLLEEILPNHCQSSDFRFFEKVHGT